MRFTGMPAAEAAGAGPDAREIRVRGADRGLGGIGARVSERDGAAADVVLRAGALAEGHVFALARALSPSAR